MEKFQKLIEAYLIPITEKIGKQRHLHAMRDGIVQVLPLILIGSFFLLIGQPPGKYLENIVKPFMPIILIPYRLTFGLIAIYVSASVAYSLAKSYKMESVSASILSAFCFFLTATPRVEIMFEGRKIFNIPSTPETGWILPMKYFGAEGLFLAIIIAILTVEMLRFLKGKKLMFTMPKGVPEVVTKAFEAILPSFLIITYFWILRDILEFDFPCRIASIFSYVQKLGDSLGAAILLTIIDSTCWFAGIHPIAIIGPFIRTVGLNLLTENASFLEKMGRTAILPHIAVDQFYFWFVWVGGSGATLGLVLQLPFARSKFLRQLGKISLVPGIFNINEPVVFGLPIVANPMMIIPFALAPLICTIIAYSAFALNLLQRPYIQSIWTLPAPLGALFSTGGDWRAFVFSVIIILISAIIYFPFIQIYDRQMLQREKEMENNQLNQKITGDEGNDGRNETN